MKRFLALVPTDFSDASSCALAHAIKLASGLGGEIHVLHVAEIPTHSVPDLPLDFIDVIESKSMAELNGQLKQFDSSLPPITKVVRTGVPSKSPAEVTLEYARDNEVDVIVMGTHGRRGTRRLLLGSVTEEVIRRSICPVLTVRQQKKACLIPTIEKILVPIDFSEASERVVEVAEKLALRTGASVTLMHIVDIEFYPFYGLTVDPVQLIERNMIDISMTKLNDKVLELRKKGLHANWETDTGHPARIVAEYAERNNIDLIVIGSHGRSGFDRMMLGSISEKVIRSAPCPTVVVNTSVIPEVVDADWVMVRQEG